MRRAADSVSRRGTGRALARVTSLVMWLAAWLPVWVMVSACGSLRPDHAAGAASGAPAWVGGVPPDPPPLSADRVMAVSEPMKAFLREQILPRARGLGRQAALAEALVQPGALQLTYSGVTRDAADAFAARSGNCLSLVLMTAALARELGLEVHFQRVQVDEPWGLQDSVLARNGHVNLTLGPRRRGLDRFSGGLAVTIDFLPPEQAARLRSEPLDEATVLAMFMNNRAAEALAAQRLVDAQAWAHEALRLDPNFLEAANTLALVLRRRGDASTAERIWRDLLARRADDTAALANLIGLLEQQRRGAEAALLSQRLAALEPVPPFELFARGVRALAQGDAALALELFQREAARGTRSHELQFQLALACLHLGDPSRARQHLAEAIEASPATEVRELYTAKLARLQRQAGGG